MAMFAKKESWENKVATEVGTGPRAVPPAAQAGASPRYGIAEAIQLMRTLPNDHVELVVRVVRATLASLDVRLPDIIEDASRKQKMVRDKIADFHAKNVELEKQLEAHRKEIAALEADLKETSEVKDRLQQAEAAGALSTPGAPAVAATKIPMATLLGAAVPVGEHTPPKV
jgi:septal ring factor EnvC (AmiA/AmiB activator)